MKKKNLSAVFLLLLFAVLLLAMGSKDAGSAKVQVSGRVRLVGNHPFSTLVITGDNREWIIEGKEQQKLMPYQQQVVTVEGREYSRDLTFASGIPAGKQYYLKDIKIVK